MWSYALEFNYTYIVPERSSKCTKPRWMGHFSIRFNSVYVTAIADICRITNHTRIFSSAHLSIRFNRLNGRIYESFHEHSTWNLIDNAWFCWNWQSRLDFAIFKCCFIIYFIHARFFVWTFKTKHLAPLFNTWHIFLRKKTKRYMHYL